MLRWLRRQWQRICPHRWDYEEGRCKRTCPRCGQHEWVMVRTSDTDWFTPRAHWQRMNFDI